jgi:hypothetical protein
MVLRGQCWKDLTVPRFLFDCSHSHSRGLLLLAEDYKSDVSDYNKVITGTLFTYQQNTFLSVYSNIVRNI